MKSYKTSELVTQKITLLIPFILYALYKNGFLIYQKNLINIFDIFKIVYLIIISLIIKFIIDLIKYRSLKWDYNVLVVIIVSMIMPYNINYICFLIGMLLSYVIANIIEEKIKFNKVCFMYLVIIACSLFFNSLTFKNSLEINYTYSFSLMDYFLGKGIGGIASTSILFSFLTYCILSSNFYYKKHIPVIINSVYFVIIIVYYFITHNSTPLLNSEIFFASVFVSTLPLYSPYSLKKQILYGSAIGFITVIISIIFNHILSIYIAIFIVSLFGNVKLKRKK